MKHGPSKNQHTPLGTAVNQKALSRRDLVKGGAAAGVATVSAASAVTGGLATPAIAQGLKKWIVVSAFPGSGVIGRALLQFCQKVTEFTGGAITFEIFNAGEREQAFDVLDAVAKGRANMGFGAPYYWEAQAPALRFVASTPFGLTASEQNTWLFRENGLELANRIYNDLGAHFLPLGNTGPQMGGWFKQEVNDVSDFNGLRFRMPGLGGEVLRSLGCKVLAIPGNAINAALKDGLLDGVEWIGPATDLAKQLHLHAKYYYHPGWHEPGTVLDLSINVGDWGQLGSEQRDIFRFVSQSINAQVYNEFQFANTLALDALTVEHQVPLRQFPDSVLKALGEASGEVLFDLAAKDKLSRDLFLSIASFRSKAKGFGAVTDGSYLYARNLPFTYPE